MSKLIKDLLSESIAVKTRMLKDDIVIKTIQEATDLCIAALENGHKLLFAGNGGSASDAQHIAAELVGRYERDRDGLPAIALTTNLSQVTAIANDYGYDSMFQRQVQALATEGDVFFGLSTSGNSENVVKAIEQCRKQGVATVGMTGESGGAMAGLCNLCIRVPSNNTARIQESHITIGHILCSGIETALFSNNLTH